MSWSTAAAAPPTQPFSYRLELVQQGTSITGTGRGAPVDQPQAYTVATVQGAAVNDTTLDPSAHR